MDNVDIIVEKAHTGAVSQSQEWSIVALCSDYLNHDLIRFFTVYTVESGLAFGGDDCFRVVVKTNSRWFYLHLVQFVEVGDVYGIARAARIDLKFEVTGRWRCGRGAEFQVDEEAFGGGLHLASAMGDDASHFWRVALQSCV